jgi:hypothetical protein
VSAPIASRAYTRRFIWHLPVWWVDDDGDLNIMVSRWHFGKHRWETIGYGYRWSFSLGPLEFRRFVAEAKS